MSQKDFGKLIKGKYPKVSLFKLIISLFKGISKPKLMWRMGKIARKSNKVYKHYKKLPKEYDSRKYFEWMLGHMSLFEEIREEK